MSDNVGYTPGVGADVAADDIAGVLYQRVKIIVGADGVNDGDVSVVNPMPVTGTIAVTGGATAAKQDTGNTSIASIDGKVVAVDTGAVVVASGSLTANAGTNLNTSLLALEDGGNLASIAGKDFATQTTLALIKAKTDNLDVPLSGGGTHVIVDSMPAAASAATATAEFPEYMEAQSATFSQDLEGNLRTRISAVVSEAVPVYIDGEVQSLSINSQGRLRVSAVSAPVYMEFFVPFDFGSDEDIRELSNSPWRALS